MGKPAKVALTACMRKLLVIVNTMLKTGQPWHGYSCTKAQMKDSCTLLRCPYLRPDAAAMSAKRLFAKYRTASRYCVRGERELKSLGSRVSSTAACLCR